MRADSATGNNFTQVAAVSWKGLGASNSYSAAAGAGDEEDAR